MKLSIAVPSSAFNTGIELIESITYNDLLNRLIVECNKRHIICYPDNIRFFIRDELVTKENWNNIQNKYLKEDVPISCILIIVPIVCPTHK